MSAEELFNALGQMLIDDFNLDSRRSEGPNEIPQAIIDQTVTACAEVPVVYTAYDGDHLQLSGLMRRIAFEKDRVPANPDSILGYKETVSANGAKRGVLMDDLSVLSGCDELWVFGDGDLQADRLASLAEGVLVELIYFLKVKGPENIVFISLQEAMNGITCFRHFPFTLSETLSVLDSDQAEALVRTADSFLQNTDEQRQIVYHAADPLDFKYSHWLRPAAYEMGYAPLVPGLAIDIADCSFSRCSLGQVVFGWLRLMKICHQLWLYPGLEFHRSGSRIVRLMKEVWVRAYPDRSASTRTWSSLPIPKAKSPKQWALTQKERQLAKP